jgi:hypothetical protein
MLNTQPGVGYSTGYFRVLPENVINKNLPTEYVSTTNQSIHYQKPLGTNIAIVNRGNSRWIVVRRYVNRVAMAITAAKADTCAE